jgi:hypothetical protein
MNQRVSGIFQIRSSDSAFRAPIETPELGPRPLVRALAWLVFAAAIAAGSFALWARATSEAGETLPRTGVAAIQRADLTALDER